MGVVHAVRRDGGQLDPARVGQRPEGIVVGVPGRHAVVVDLVGVEQLRPQIGGVQLTGQVAVAKIDPCVLVHLTAEELGAVRALLAQDLCALIVRGIVDDECAALAHRVVLCLVEGVAAEITDGAQCLALVAAHNALRRVLDDLEVMAAGNVHDGVHLTGDTGVVHGDDDPRLIGDGLLDLRLVDVHRVGADVHKDELRPGQHSGGGGAGEGVAGQNDLVTGVNIAQQHGHVQRRSAAGGQQDLLGVEALLQPGVALLGKGAVAADFVRVDGLLDVVELVAHAGRYVKRDHSKSLPSGWIFIIVFSITQFAVFVTLSRNGFAQNRLIFLCARRCRRGS